MTFDKYPNVFNTPKAALSFLTNVRNAGSPLPTHVVAKVGRKYACVDKTFAKRMKLKVIKEKQP